MPLRLTRFLRRLMNELQAAGAALSSLKAAFDLSKAFLDVKSAVEIQGKVFELQRVILAAQQDALRAQESQAALLQNIRDLEAQLASRNAWGAEKQRYSLRDYGNGTFAYELKVDAANGEPEHRLCPACFHAERKSILQFILRTDSEQDRYDCTACETSFFLGVRQKRARKRPQSSSWMTR